MKRKSLLFIFTIVFALTVLSGCKKHECESPDNIRWSWDSNETEHWKKCECGKSFNIAEHEFGEWTIEEEPDEYEKGSKERKCSICHYKEIEEIPALVHDHTFSDKLSYNENYHFYFATCEHYSYTKDMEPHSFSLVESKEPTCTEKGYNTYRCICGYKYTDEINFKEHEYQNDICIKCSNPVPCDNLKFIKNSTNDGYYVSGLKDTTATDEIIVIPNKYEGLKVEAILMNAFRNNSSVKKIVLSANITSISSYSFAGCTSLEAINIPYAVKEMGSNVFDGCSSLKNVTIAEGVEAIGISAFKNCTSLEEITLPDSFNNIDSTTFYGCKALKKINIPKRIQIIDNSAFYNCISLEDITLPSTLASIGINAFYNCDSLKEISIPNSTKIINVGAFSECNNLESINLNEGLISIGSGAFFGCSKLKNIAIPKTVESIGFDAFTNTIFLEDMQNEMPLVIINNILIDAAKCSGEVIIPEEIKKIGYGIFNNCQNEISIIANGIEAIDDRAFEGCRKLLAITLPEEMNTIGINAFKKCSMLKEITIPNKITEIPTSCFYGCTSLEEVILPSSITKINDYSFYQCESLNTITLPNNTNIIGEGSFEGCLNLKSITFNEFVEEIGQNAFKSTPWLTDKQTENPLVAYNNILIDAHAASGDITIPEGIEYISDGAFSSNDKITSVTLSATV